MIRYAVFYCLLFLGIISHSFAQKITLNGNIFSFKGEKVMLLKKAQKNVSFNGSLENATIRVMGESTNLTITTGLSGSFNIPLERPGRYKIEITKNGYSTLDVHLEYNSAGKKTRFDSFFFILKQEDNANVHMGTIEINEGLLVFAPDDEELKNTKNDLLLSNSLLIEKAMLINKTGGGSFVNNTPSKNIEKEKTINKTKEDTKDSASAKKTNTEINSILDKNTETNIDSLRSNLNHAKKLLANLSPESKEFNLLSKQILIAEQRIKDGETIIDLQKKEISFSNKLILFVSLIAVFALASTFLFYYFFKQKKRYSIILKEKSANIVKINTKLYSSIRYASLIQISFLQNKEKLKNLFSDSFVYTAPKDILSGDFYWFAQKNGYKIVVLADCTGHGIPGAMLTVLGHNVLEDVINVQGIVLPSKIIMALNKAIQQTFAKNTHYLEYGMDLTVISLKDKSNEVLYSGVKNGMYRIRDGEKMFFAVSPKSLGADVEEKDFADQKIDIIKGDSLFMFSDGYVDQFNSDTKKIVKFNISRFEKLLTKISSNQNFNDAEVKLEKTLLDWKGERDQVDDICILGIRI